MFVLPDLLSLQSARQHVTLPPASSARTKRLSDEKANDRRQALLSAALQILGKKGYNATAIAEVARETGLTLPGLLHYFPSKSELLIAILKQRDEELRALAADHSGDWRLRLTFVCDVVQRNAADPEAIRLFSILNAESLDSDHPAASWFKKRADDIVRFIADSIQEGIEAGEIRPGTDPVSVARQIIAMVDGLQLLWLRSPEQFDMVQCLKDFICKTIESMGTR